MKNQNMLVNLKSMALLSAFLLAMALSTSAFAQYWNGSASSDWANAANWTGGLPTGAGAAIINPGSPYLSPNVSTSGNFTGGQLYLSIGAGLSVVSGGQLNIGSDLVTGMWGNSSTLSVSGGTLNIGGYLNIGAGGYVGNVSISGGTIDTINLTFNPASASTLDISGSGSLVAPIAANLGNINYWIANNTITANGGAAGYFINVDTTSLVGNVVLTVQAVPEPSTMALFGLSAVFLGLISRRR